MISEPAIWILIGMAVVVFVAAGIFRDRRNQVGGDISAPLFHNDTILVSEMPDVIKDMPTEGEKVFVTFMFYAQNQVRKKNLVNLNVLLYDGRKQFDWYLGAPKNMKDADRFMEFAAAKGYTISEASTAENVVIRQADLGAICIDVATEMYGLSLTDRVEVMRHW